MISYAILFVAGYAALLKSLPILQGATLEHDYWAQAVRHLVVLYLAAQLTDFLWRQKFVSIVSAGRPANCAANQRQPPP